MQLSELVSRPAQIVFDLQAGDRWQAIDELIGALVRCGDLSAAQGPALIAAVRERERTMSTGIGNGIGIPHAPSELVDRVHAVLGIARHDVDFAALDGRPVRLVMLFVVPKNQFQAHLDTLANIARVFGDTAIRQRLCEAQNAEQVYDIIQSTRRG